MLILLVTVIISLSVALYLGRLYDRQRRVADRQMILYEVLRAIGRHMEPEAVVRSAVETIGRLTGWPGVAILLPDNGGAMLAIQAAAGSMTGQEASLVVTDEGAVGGAFRSGESRYRPKAANAGQPATKGDVASELAVPLIHGGKVLGVLWLQSDRPAAFHVGDQHLATSLAEAIALALDNARFHTAMRKHAANLNALYSINRMLGRSLVMEELLAKILYSALASLRFGSGVICLLESPEERLTVVAERGLPPELVAHWRQDGLEGSFCAYAQERQEVIVIGDLQQETAELQRLRQESPQVAAELASQQIRSGVGLPLWHQRHLVGTMCLYSRHPRSFTADELDLYTAIGQQIGIGLVNARLFGTIADERTLLQALIEASRDGIILVGPRQRIRVVNQPALDFLGLPGRPRYWLDKPVAQVLLALRRDSPAVVRAALAEVRRLQNGTQAAAEGELQLPPRTVYWASLPVKTGLMPLGRLLVLRDVTEERLVTQMREDLVHTMVHDLRNPLTSIFGAIEFLENELFPVISEDHQQVLEIARVNTQQMVDLITAILDINRLESGHMPINRGLVSLPDLVASVLRAQLPLAERKRLIFEDRVPIDLPLAWVDGELFERVLQNLVGNAIKFTPPGGQVGVRAWVSMQEQPELVLSISDTGPGVPADVEGRLFQKFTTGQRGKGGTGLGLAFCKMVVEAHGGRIWAESPSGKGATFTFTMPLLAEEVSVLS
ncbi:MAG: GAF domain-containing protein [Chloroflexi bacterium]|nr:GAF domain-containing protein [Chloroflexota bacterium]MCI0575265.1 GAF domain-containing protein [Chloroflexota bacterium]MCI0645711.1 GAF domain-containing protein [Chloroflexota bacterium]MCI0731242.1 GAF domain-containing protein [Chloroflexota bacterium]